MTNKTMRQISHPGADGRNHAQQCSALLSHAWETAAALRAVVDLEGKLPSNVRFGWTGDDASSLHAAAKGFLFILEASTSGPEGDAPAAAIDAAKRKFARLQATAHRDPIYRVLLALRGFQAALETVLARPADGRAEGVAYTIGLLYAEWEAVADGYLSDEADRRELHRLIALCGLNKRRAVAA
jgi:hypothetical protein